MTFDRSILARLTPWGIIAVGLGSLAMALIAEHLYDLEPCILCLYQRLPYVATVLLALLALKLPTDSKAVPLIIGLCGLAYLGGAGVAIDHVGVEQHWWVSGCTGETAGKLSFGDLKAALSTRPAKSCDDVDWTLFGISMAAYNVAFSSGLAAVSLGLARVIWKNDDPKKTEPEKDTPVQTPAR